MFFKCSFAQPSMGGPSELIVLVLARRVCVSVESESVCAVKKIRSESSQSNPGPLSCPNSDDGHFDAAVFTKISSI